ncbi:MAG: hypothetical protein KDD42_09070 [Bdellovibrionales bacterium]|nr:hypothetical protein [Bdellovibrionales bacterium]
MQQDCSDEQVIELTRELPELAAVYFDGERVRLEGSYSDQLSAYRAKKVWLETLSLYFLLEEEQDVEVQVDSRLSESRYLLSCDFLSACARYAFWRITNHQTPEVQYLIETAHIPQSESRRDDFLLASDLKPIGQKNPSILGGGLRSNAQFALSRLYRRVMRRIYRSKNAR